MKKHIMMSVLVLGFGLVAEPVLSPAAVAAPMKVTFKDQVKKGKAPVRSPPPAPPPSSKRHKPMRLNQADSARLAKSFQPGSRKAIRLPAGVNAGSTSSGSTSAAASGSGGRKPPPPSTAAKGHYTDYAGRSQKQKSVKAGAKQKIAVSAKPGKPGIPPRRDSVISNGSTASQSSRASVTLARLQRNPDGSVRGVTAPEGTAARALQESRAIERPSNIQLLPGAQGAPSNASRTATGRPLQVRQTGTLSVWGRVKRFFSSKKSSAQDPQ